MLFGGASTGAVTSSISLAGCAAAHRSFRGSYIPFPRLAGGMMLFIRRYTTICP